LELEEIKTITVNIEDKKDSFNDNDDDDDDEETS
jgi:hypothetical protein